MWLLALMACRYGGEPYCEPEIEGDRVFVSEDNADAAWTLVTCCRADAHVIRGVALGSFAFDVRGVDSDGVCVFDYGQEVELSGWSWARCEVDGPFTLPEAVTTAWEAPAPVSAFGGVCER